MSFQEVSGSPLAKEDTNLNLTSYSNGHPWTVVTIPDSSHYCEVEQRWIWKTS